MAKKDTNITKAHKEAFEAIKKFNNIALFSCFVNGEKASAIVAVNTVDGEYQITPLFVAVTPSMIITDHEGVKA